MTVHSVILQIVGMKLLCCWRVADSAEEAREESWNTEALREEACR